MQRLLFVISCLAASAASAQQLATEFKSTEVADGIYMIAGADGFGGGNMAVLIGDDYVAMIDDGIGQTASTLLDFVQETAGRPIDFLVNTHVHGDHVGGNAQFADRGTVVFAHDNIRKRLLESPGDAGGPGGIPVVTFAHGVTWHLNGIEARIFHLAKAHTDGDAAVFFPRANVIHTGDLHFHKLYPFIDLDSGGTVGGYIAGMQKLIGIANEDTIVIPGHGDLATKADLQTDVEMIIDSRRRVKAMIDAGATADEVVADSPLAIYHDTYDWAFISTEIFTRTLYRDIKENN
ncbi:MAG: MBL fold metallo-hydrolase [Woeseiaceae bacterium]